MSETEFLGPATENVMGNMPQADVSTSDTDKALQAIWDKNNGPDSKKPLMPDVPAGEDIFKATADWMKLPLKERQQTSAVHREFADLKKQGEALGMKTESAADMKAIQDMLAVKDEKAAPIDRETQATYDTVRAVFPDAKDNREATNSLRGLVDHVARDPVEGTLAVLKSLPLTPYQRHQVYERMFGDAMQQQQPQQAEPAVAPYLDKWAKQSGATKQDMTAMADIMSDPTWREIAGESDKSALDRAYKALQRRGRPSSEGRVNAGLDKELRGLAAEIYRP